MAADDNREFIEFYAIRPIFWPASFGTFIDTDYLLVRKYVDEGCDFEDYSKCQVGGNQVTHKFLYPQHIKKTYYIEGTIEGLVSFTVQGTGVGTHGSIEYYRVSVCKVSKHLEETELATTGWVDVRVGGVPLVLNWDNVLGVGDEKVFPFFIPVWEEQEITENERIYLQVQTKGCNTYTYLVCANDSSYNTTFVEIPFRL